MTTIESDRVSEVADALEALIVEQKDIEEEGDSEKKKNAKDATKKALFEFLSTLSTLLSNNNSSNSNNKTTNNSSNGSSSSSMEERDKFLLGHSTTLKWPLLRSLQHSHHYSALLHLPQTLEQIRQFLTSIPIPKLQDIFVIQLDLVSSSSSDVSTILAVENGLQYLIGDGQRKKDLGGFILSGAQKGILRSALNRAKKRHHELLLLQQVEEEKKKKPTTATTPTSSTTKVVTTSPMKQKYFFDHRDVRLVDQEQTQARAHDLGALVDAALKQTNNNNNNNNHKNNKKKKKMMKG